MTRTQLNFREILRAGRRVHAVVLPFVSSDSPNKANGQFLANGEVAVGDLKT
jgi:hypothetical protein